MAAKASGSEILLCLGIYLCVHIYPCVHTQISLCATLMAMRAAVRWDESGRRECGDGWGYRERMQGEGRVLRRMCVNRAVVHTVPLTSCEACSQWEMNLQRMSPSDIQEMLH